MKRFLKFVAALLAMTLIIGTVPVMAATSFTYKTPRALFVDGCKGTKSSGKKATYKSYVKATKLVEGFDSKTMTLKVKSSDTSVASVSKTKITAKKPGKATVTITVYDSKGKQLDSGSVVITVKKNASASDLTYKGITNGATYNTGDKVTVSLPLGTDTDKRRLTAKTNNITVKSAGTRKWTVTFNKAGAFELLAEAYQSATYKGTTASQTIKGTVEDEDKPLVIDVKQKALNTLVISGLKEEIEKADVKIYSSATDNKTSRIKEVKYNAKEGTATITMFNNTDFVADTVYTVEVDGAKATFKAVSATLKDVTKMILETAEAKKGTDTPLVFKYIGDNEVDITAEVSKYINMTNLTLEIINTDVNAYLSGSSSITFTKENEIAQIKATLITGYNTTTNEPYKVIASGQVRSYTDVFDGSMLYTITEDDNVYMTPKTPMNTEIKIGDNLCLEVLFELTSKTYQTFNDTGYWVKSSDETVVMIGSRSNSGGFFLTPNKAGTASLLIMDGPHDATAKGIAAIPVTVKAASVPTRFEVKFTNNKQYLNLEPSASDSIRIQAIAYDQYGKEYPGANFTIEQDANSIAATGVISPLAFNSYGLCIINGTNVTPSGKGNQLITLKINCTDIKNSTAQQKPIYVAKVTATDVDAIYTPNSTRMVVEGDTILDTMLKAGTQEVKNTTVLANFLSGNYLVTEGIGKLLKTAPTNTLTASGLSVTSGTTGLYFTVSHDGKVIDPADAKYSSCFVYDEKSIEFRPIIRGKKLPVGNYVVTVYKIKAFDMYSQVVPLGTQTIKVIESEPDATYIRKASDGSGTLPGALANFFTLYYEGTDVTSSITSAKYNGPDSNSGAVYVYSITVGGLLNSIYGSFSYTFPVDDKTLIYVK